MHSTATLQIVCQRIGGCIIEGALLRQAKFSLFAMPNALKNEGCFLEMILCRGFFWGFLNFFRFFSFYSLKYYYFAFSEFFITFLMGEW